MTKNQPQDKKNYLSIYKFYKFLTNENNVKIGVNLRWAKIINTFFLVFNYFLTLFLLEYSIEYFNNNLSCKKMKIKNRKSLKIFRKSKTFIKVAHLRFT